MKRLIIAIMLAATTVACAQQLESKQIYLGPGSKAADTLNYLKTFETNKSKYVGKPFSVLLSDLGKVQPTLAMPGSGQALNDVSSSPRTYFMFGGRSRLYDYEIVNLEITWKDPLPADTVYGYAVKDNSYFTTEQKNYYSNKIVMNIKVYRRMDLTH